MPDVLLADRLHEQLGIARDRMLFAQLKISTDRLGAARCLREAAEALELALEFVRDELEGAAA